MNYIRGALRRIFKLDRAEIIDPGYRALIEKDIFLGILSLAFFFGLCFVLFVINQGHFLRYVTSSKLILRQITSCVMGLYNHFVLFVGFLIFKAAIIKMHFCDSHILFNNTPIRFFFSKFFHENRLTALRDILSLLEKQAWHT